jgi:chromosome segregation ATPase
MLYSVSEISSLIGLSRQSIYKKLKAKELQIHISHKKGIVYIDEVGFNLIKAMLNEYIKGVKDLNNKEIATTLNEEVSKDTDNLTLNKELFNLLKDQLKENNKQMQTKDKQIEELNERLKQEQDLNKNNQVLQLRQPQDIKALESHFQDLDTKLEEVKEKMQEIKYDQKPKSFLSKLFDKK